MIFKIKTRKWKPRFKKKGNYKQTPIARAVSEIYSIRFSVKFIRKPIFLYHLHLLRYLIRIQIWIWRKKNEKKNMQHCAGIVNNTAFVSSSKWERLINWYFAFHLRWRSFWSHELWWPFTKEVKSTYNK